MFNGMNSNGDSKYKVSKHILEDFIKWNFTWCIWKYNVKIKLWARSRSLKPLIERVRENLDRASSLIQFFKTLTKNIFECAHEYEHPNIIKIKNYIWRSNVFPVPLERWKCEHEKKIWPHFLGLYQCPLFTLQNCYCATYLQLILWVKYWMTLEFTSVEIL